MKLDRPTLFILGTRGIPAAHGGFETFAEKLAVFLAGRGYRVVVYCQRNVNKVTQRFTHDLWNGIERVTIEVAADGPAGTFVFDWHSVRDARRRNGVVLVLGYNTATLLPLLKGANRPILTNMDGLEWKRAKWSRPIRMWLRANERIAIWTSDRLIADHPAIASHLAGLGAEHRVVMIPYGADQVREADSERVRAFGVEPDRYLISIARIEPENGLLTLVRAHARQAKDKKLVVLGTIDPDNAFHREVMAAASPDVLFPGAIYERETVEALRFFARAYFHGHSVGGTNPSLVEALAAGSAVLAHDNVFNRWTAGERQFYYRNIDECSAKMAQIFDDDQAVALARAAARRRGEEEFAWHPILMAYEREISALQHSLVRPSQPVPVKVSRA